MHCHQAKNISIATFNLKTSKDSVVWAVCFSPEKHAELRHLEHAKSPVKLQNFGGAINGSDVFVFKQTKIAQVPTESLGYAYAENMTSSAEIKIANLRLRRVAPEQLVSLTVEVAHVAPVKTINTQYGSTLKKQELVVRDTSGSIKLILWQEYVESLQESKTYRLQNVRVKISKDETYINTAKSEQFVVEEVEAFDGDLPPVDADMVGMATSKVHGKIVGVLNISKTLACISCFKKVTSKNEKIGNCESCKVMQFLKACPRQWFLRVLVQTTDADKKKIRLNMFTGCVQRLSELLGLQADINNLSEDELMLQILESQKLLFVHYDVSQNKIINIEAEPSV